MVCLLNPNSLSWSTSTFGVGFINPNFFNSCKNALSSALYCNCRWLAFLPRSSLSKKIGNEGFLFVILGKDLVPWEARAREDFSLPPTTVLILVLSNDSPVLILWCLRSIWSNASASNSSRSLISRTLRLLVGSTAFKNEDIVLGLLILSILAKKASCVVSIIPEFLAATNACLAWAIVK